MPTSKRQVTHQTGDVSIAPAMTRTTPAPSPLPHPSHCALWTADISFNNKLTCNSNSAAYLAISQYQVRPMPFALHWVAYAAQNLVSRVHSTVCVWVVCVCVSCICVRMCVWHASKFISAQDKFMRLSGIFRRRLQLRLRPGMLLRQPCVCVCVTIYVCAVACFLLSFHLFISSRGSELS